MDRIRISALSRAPACISLRGMKNQLKTLLLLGILTTIVVAIGGSVSQGGLMIALGFAVLMNVGAYWFSDKIVLAMNGAKPIGPDQMPEVYEIVQELTQRAGMPMPKVYLMEDAQPNAFATGRSPSRAAVAVTAGILQILDRRELRGVIAHELAHVKNRDTLVSCVAAVMAGVVTALANMLQWAAIFGGGRSDDEEGGSPIGAIALAIIAPIAASMVQFGISRSREYLADQTGAQISGDPEALARALEKLRALACECTNVDGFDANGLWFRKVFELSCMLAQPKLEHFDNAKVFLRGHLAVHDLISHDFE